MNKFKVLILEDELLIAHMLRSMLSEMGHEVVIAHTFEKGLRALEDHKEIDLAILDINLNEWESGIEFAEKLRNETSVPFIFLTSYSDRETVRLAGRTKPEAYLLKPFTEEEVFATLELISSRREVENSFLPIKDKGVLVKVFVKDIDYFKSENAYVEVHSNEKMYLIRSSLEKVLQSLESDSFLRTHRSFAVNRNKVQATASDHLIINDQEIPISRKYKEILLKVLGAS